MELWKNPQLRRKFDRLACLTKQGMYTTRETCMYTSHIQPLLSNERDMSSYAIDNEFLDVEKIKIQKTITTPHEKSKY
jgi:hypothetical protein